VRCGYDGPNFPVYRKVFHLGIDPSARVPALFGSIGFEKLIYGRVPLFSWRLSLPLLRWKCNGSRLRNWLYQHQESFRFSLDGRGRGRS
jgi:hypothetical protein